MENQKPSYYFFMIEKIDNIEKFRDIISLEKGIKEYNLIYKPILEANGVYIKASDSLKLSISLKRKFRIKIVSEYDVKALIDEDKLQEVLLTLLTTSIKISEVKY